MSTALEKLAQRLKAREGQNALRRLSAINDLVDFSSNDYLGLSTNQDLQQSVDDAYKVGSQRLGATGSRLLSGNSTYALSLEKFLADYYSAEAALLFNSGYNANTALLQAIPQRGDTIIYDELIHASLKEGARLSFATKYSFKHNNLSDLEKKIQKAEGVVYVVVESIYSMDGDQCDLQAIVTLCQKYDANIILDEAHSTGVLGVHGNGLACLEGIESQIFARLHTFGKGMGCHGAIVVGNKILIDYLINFGLSFIYTTALPIHSLVTIKCAHEYLREHLKVVELLRTKIDLFDSLMAECPFMIQSSGPIKAVKIPGNDQVKKVAELIQKAGFDVRPIMSPTVKKGEERLRICLHNYNSDTEITELCDLLNNNLR